MQTFLEFNNSMWLCYTETVQTNCGSFIYIPNYQPLNRPVKGLLFIVRCYGTVGARNTSILLHPQKHLLCVCMRPITFDLIWFCSVNDTFQGSLKLIYMNSIQVPHSASTLQRCSELDQANAEEQYWAVLRTCSMTKKINRTKQGHWSPKPIQFTK